MSTQQSDTFDLSTVTAAAVEDLASPLGVAAAAESTAQAEPASTTEETPAAETPEPAPPEEEVIEVNAAGQRLKVTRDELIKGYQRDADYRQKTMALADARRQLDYAQQQLAAERQQLQHQVSQIQTVLNDPEKLRQLAVAHAQQQNLPTSPDEVLTVAQAEALFKAHLARTQQDWERRLAENQRTTETKQWEHQYMQELSAHASALVKQHPILEDVDDVTLLLLKDARDANPRSIDDVKAFMAESAQRRAVRLEKRLQDHTKMAVVRQAKISKPSIEPPGAQAPASTAPRSRPLRLGDADLTAAVIADLAATPSKR